MRRVRRAYKSIPVPTVERTPEEIKQLCEELVQASVDVNKARDDMRKFAEQLAGCDLKSWKFVDIERYVDLYITTAQRTINFLRAQQ